MPFVLIAATSNAQIVPLVPGGVTVTPDGATTPVRVANTGGYSAVFTVTNTGGASATFTITCWGAGGVICTDVDQPTLTIAAGASKTDAATYDVGAPGTGRIVLRASNASAEDTGYFNVPIVALSGPPVALRNHNGDNRDRSLCLTSGAGEAAAWQCGDLTVTHGLPGYSTMGRERSLTLLYSSVQAVPRPIVAATVDETGLSVPLSVFVRLSLNGIPRDSATYNAWTTGPFARQIVIAHDGAADSSGIYPFTLMVRNQYADATSETSVSDTLLIVNRAASRYGTGWSLVGVEELRLNQPGNKILWIGGDGSAKVYRNIATDVWLAAAGAFRDTLVRFDSASASWYRRTMRHGVKVTFKSCCSGNRALHVRTTNRTGQSTVLTWSLDQTPLYPDTLKSITVPPGIAGTTYTLAYASGKLDRITDPAGRVLDATVSSGRLTSLLDPDTYSTGFGYDGVGRMTSRTTRRSYTTKFFYPQGLRVDSVKVPLNPSTGDTAKTVFYPWDERGLAVGPTGQTAVDTALIYTKVDGPRTNVGDTAVFRVDRWGAPTRITDPLGRVTTVARGNALVPALDTLVSYADGRRVRMLWNARGNLTEMRDSTSHLGVAGLPTAVTRWTYFSANTKDSPDTVIDPEGLKTRYVYNTWGLATDATAPNGHVTHFDYVPTGSLIGLVQAVTEQQVPAWDTLTKTKPLTNLRTGFAFNTLGNLLSDTSPMLRVRTYTRDGVQRVTRVYDPAGHNTEFVYDPLNRVLQSKQHVEPFDSGYAAPLVTWQYFGIDVLDSISDPRSVVRRYVYDAANRRTTEKNDYGVAEVTFYNRAGLVDSVVSRLGLTTRYVWDAGGQLTKKAWPARSPLLKDSILYTYDLMGRALTQTQPVRDRKITRTYFSRGLLKSEVQSLVNGTFPNTMTYAYDRNGRRTYHIIGTVGVLNSSDSIWYRYAAVSGDLAVVGVRWRNPI
ncbi:MAG: hypothetical protein ACREJ4_03315, partial [Candidatus Methylomirabilaceae bacterium]